MFRHEVPVDDEVHAIKLTSGPRGVACGVRGRDHFVEFWAEREDSQPLAEWRFRVFGAGQPLPDKAVYAGTAPRTPDGLVWHLYVLPY